MPGRTPVPAQGSEVVPVEARDTRSDAVLRINRRQLSAQHRAIRYRQDFRAALLYGPLLLFVLMFFAVPLAAMLYRSVDNPEVRAAFPRTLHALADWSPAPGELPSDATFAVLRDEIAIADGKVLSAAGGRLNYEIPQFRGLLAKTARRLATIPAEPDARRQLLSIDEAWGQLGHWAAVKRNASALTDHYYLSAFDFERNERNQIVRRDDSERVFLQVLVRTLWISLVVTMICLLIGFPLAYTMTIVRGSAANLMMMLVLIPLWTSLLVRSIAWVMLLQREGLVNELLVSAGILNERVRLVFNRTGLLIAMVHVLLPFMVLPIYSVLKKMNPQYVRAALSLGASPVRAFFTVYLPLAMPGVAAGVVLVFIVAVGYYITPELVGGADDQMISHFIAYFTNQALNWGQAAALATVLLFSIIAIYMVYSRSSLTTPLLPR
jgi:putative spermidine/putrescine transport system permease protein